MLELASLGAQVLMNRSVELANRYGVVIEVLSSYVRKPGTKVKEVAKKMEEMKISGIAKDNDVARIAAVSYTHLGFKNPSISGGSPLASEGVGSYWPFATGKRVTQANLLLEQIPVSYTHLDVYKRQDTSFAIWPSLRCSTSITTSSEALRSALA